MSINAQIQFTGDTSSLTWDDTNKVWTGVIVKVIYATAQTGETQQTYTSNSPSVGDYIIDESGKVWKITLVDTTWTAKTSNYHFKISIKVQNRTVSEDVEPEAGNTFHGAICTPTNNALNPLTNTSMIASNVISTALYFNIDKSLISGGSGGSTGGAATQVGTLVSTDSYATIGDELIMCSKEGDQTINLTKPSKDMTVINVKKISSLGTKTIHATDGATIDNSSSDLNLTTQNENITLNYYQNNWNIV